MKKVSVIVPVYNSELHLRQCLDSIKNQTLTDIEIICIDDGSSDASISIIEEYMKTDDRFQLYTQKHLYAGVARNLGKSRAVGEYLAFWDSDDFFDLHALELMYQRAKEFEADICVCGGKKLLEDIGREMVMKGYLVKAVIPETEPFNLQTNRDHILNFTNEAAWTKIFRRKFVEEKQLNFQAIRNGNDVFFTISALCMADRIVTVDKPLVHYRSNQTLSLVSTLSKSAVSPFGAWMDTADYLISKGRFPEKSFANKAIGSVIYLLRNISNPESFYEAVNLLKSQGLEKMHIYVQPEGYYYPDFHKEVVDHLYSDSVADFAVYFSNFNYRRLIYTEAGERIFKVAARRRKRKYLELQKELDDSHQMIEELKKELDTIQNSRLYRLLKKIFK